jgi:hypothetical protein
MIDGTEQHLMEKPMAVIHGAEDFDPLVAKKFDSGKSWRPELIPPEFIKATATILEFGARKYSPGNWRHGMEWSRLYGGLQRHLNAWAAGEELDPESGKPHLWHACCMLAFLVGHTERGIGTDDRVSVGMIPNKGTTQ